MKSQVGIGKNRQKEEAIEESMCVQAEEIKASKSTRVLAIPSVWHLVCDKGLKGSSLKKLCRAIGDT